MNCEVRSEVFNMDCLEYMKTLPDNYFDLCIADPPYRNMSENQPTKDMRKNGSMANFQNKPTKEMLDEIFRISKNQIIWGANNFDLPNYKGFVVWEKLTISEKFTMSMAEIAYISEGLGTVSKIFKCMPQGVKEKRIHPTQKPLELYSWLLKLYANKGDKIFDPFLGSGSSRIAAYKMGFDFVGCEIDEEYFRLSEERFQKECKGVEFLKNGMKVIQQSLF